MKRKIIFLNNIISYDYDEANAHALTQLKLFSMFLEESQETYPFLDM